MKQVKVNNVLYVIDTEAYEITQDTDAGIIFVPEDSYADYVELNPDLTLTKYNYNMFRVTTPEWVQPEPPAPTSATITATIEVTQEEIDDEYGWYLIPLNFDSQTHQPIPKQSVDYFTSITVDGTEISLSSLDEQYGQYMFSTAGTHTIVYTLKDTTDISNSLFSTTDMNTGIWFNSVTISDNTTSIGGGAFMGCEYLDTVTILSTTPPTLGQMVFKSMSNQIIPSAIYVPAESVDVYKAATNWSDYADVIQAIND